VRCEGAGQLKNPQEYKRDADERGISEAEKEEWKKTEENRQKISQETRRHMSWNRNVLYPSRIAVESEIIRP
jgi:hypothetical protein